MKDVSKGEGFNNWGYGNIKCSFLPSFLEYTREPLSPEQEKLCEEIRSLFEMFPYVLYWKDESHEEGSWGYVLCTDIMTSYELMEEDFSHSKCEVYETRFNQWDDRNHAHTPTIGARIWAELSRDPLFENKYDETSNKYFVERPTELIQGYLRKYK